MLSQIPRDSIYKSVIVLLRSYIRRRRGPQLKAGQLKPENIRVHIGIRPVNPQIARAHQWHIVRIVRGSHVSKSEIVHQRRRESMRLRHGQKSVVYRQENRKIQVRWADRRSKLRAQRASAERQIRMEILEEERNAQRVLSLPERLVVRHRKLIVLKRPWMAHRQPRLLLKQRQRRIDWRQRRQQESAVRASKLIAFEIQQFHRYRIQQTRVLRSW